MPAKVVVIGSLNMDLVTRAPRLPRGGETLIGESFATVSGGKGANQAVAAARLGAQVSMVGCVGSDAYGEQLRGALLAEQIDCQAVSTVDDSSGVALIVVDDNSQNAIVIVAGANGALTAEVIDRFDAVLQAADVIICQLEVPDATVGHALKRGRELGKTVILNPAPASRPLYDVLTCIRHKTTLERAGRKLSCNAERYLKPPAQVARLFADMPDALTASLELADRLQFSMQDLGYRFPSYPVPPGENETSFLRKITEVGARKSYRDVKHYKRRKRWLS